jgi:hypothetical protein
MKLCIMLEFFCLCIKLKRIIKTNLASNSNLIFEIYWSKRVEKIIKVINK